jgi:membrane protein
MTAFASFRVHVSWLELTKRTASEVIEDGCAGLAAQLAFYFLLALFPALAFLLSLLAYVPVSAAVGDVISRLQGVLPGEIVALVRDEADHLLAGRPAGLLTAAIAGAIWSSSSAVTAIITALNRAFDVVEWRPWWKRRLIAIVLTIAMAVFAIIALTLIIGGADLAGGIADAAGMGRTFERTWVVVEWPLAFGLVVLGVDLVYHVAPNTEAAWAWITPGALLATVLWLLASVGFKIYVQQFSNYNAVYGAIDSVVVLMLWFYVSGFALLIGAELDAEIDKLLVSPRVVERPGAPPQSRS